MKSIRQLIRQPVKSLVGVLLLTVACVLLCAGVGQYAAAVRTNDRVENDYITAALLTSKYNKIEILDDAGNVLYEADTTFLAGDAQSFYNDLVSTRTDLIKRVDSNGLVSGYSSQLAPINPCKVIATETENMGSETSIDCVPYQNTVFAMRLDEIGPYSDSFGLSYVTLTGTITQVVALQEDYDDPTGSRANVTLYVTDEEELESMDLQTGEIYLVNGRNYTDGNWDALGYLGFTDEVPEDIEPDDLQLLSEEERKSWAESDADAVAKYEGENGITRLLTQDEYDMLLSKIGSISVNVDSEPSAALLLEEFSVPEGDGNGTRTVTAEEYNELYGGASITRLTGSVEDFLASPEGEEWREAIDRIDICNHAVPVMNVDHLESMVEFVRGEAIITQGRSMTDEEYEEGAHVCVMSESLAANSGLAVGDKLNLSLYLYDSNLNSQTKSANPSADVYSPVRGFYQENVEYEIVGLYRQSNEWLMDSYAFTPNTVFVPAEAVPYKSSMLDSGVFRTVVLVNGAQEEMDEYLTESGYEGLFTYYDQGYSDVSESLSSYFSVSKIVLLATLGGWLALFLLYMLLFPFSQRRSGERMWTLGASPAQIRGHVTWSGFALAVPASIIGGVVGSAMLNKVVERVADAADVSIAMSVEWTTVALMAAAQLLLCLAGSFLCGQIVLRRARRKAGGS